MVACKDVWPQFGKDDVDVIRFASIRFDHALDEDDRASVVRALASRTTSITSWSTAAERTYAIVRGETPLDPAAVRNVGATLDDPALLVLRVRPLYAPRLASLVHAFGGPGRPKAVIAAHACPDEIVLELEPSGRALVISIALVDAILAATPGRTIEPVLPISDDVLAQFVSLRLRDTELDANRVLDTYVETMLASSSAVS